MFEEVKKKILLSGNWRIIIRPLKFEKEKLNFEDLLPIITNCSVSLRGWDYPHIHSGGPFGKNRHGIDYFESATDFRYHTEISRFYQSGQFIHRFAFPEDGNGDTTSFWVLGNLYKVTEIYQFASNLAAREVLGDNLNISVEINKTANRSLKFNDPMFELGPYECSEDKLLFSDNFSKTDITARASEIALDRTKWIFQRFGWMSKNLIEILKSHQDQFLNGNFRFYRIS